MCMQTSSPVGKSCKAKDQGLSFRTLSDAFYITHISSFDIFSHKGFVFGIASFHSPRMPKMTCHLLRPVLSWISWRPSPISAFKPPAVLVKTKLNQKPVINVQTITVKSSKTGVNILTPQEKI